MLDPSILVGPGTTAGNLGPVVAAALVSDERISDPIATSHLRSLATVIQLQSSLDCATTLQDAAERAARMIADHLSAKRVLILWRDAPGQPLSTVADSDQQARADRGDQQRVVAAAGEEIAARDSLTNWPTDDPISRHALMAVSQMAEHLTITALSAVPLSDQHSRSVGAVVVLEANDETASGFLTAIGSPLAGKFASLRRLQPTRTEIALRRVAELARSRQRGAILAALILLALLMLLPLRYRVTANLELQPVQRRFIAAPVDGPLQSAYVRPGDVVQKGDLLAEINPREIDYELAGIRAQWQQSEQEKKGLMAEHDFAGSKIAALESTRLRLQSDLLQFQRDNLEIRSPISGVVVSGDLTQSEGMPMSRGETLFEVAPLGHIVVEIGVPEDDVAEVRDGMSVDFYVHAFPNRIMHGTIDRLHPRAELRQHDNVFVAEVLVEDSDSVLRPGMRGRATIVGDRHPLGWNLFHKAYFATRHTIGW